MLGIVFIRKYGCKFSIDRMRLYSQRWYSEAQIKHQIAGGRNFL